MESRINYTIVGLTVLILTAGFISTALWLSVGFNNKVYNYYLVYIREAVNGLNEQAPVKYNGVQVGNVAKIRLNRSNPQSVEILLSIEQGTPITTSTYATLISQGITGVAFVGLSATSSDLTPLERQPGERYPIIPARPSLFHQLDKVLQDVSENVNKVSQQVQKIFDKENVEYVKTSLANLKTFSTVIARNSAKISSSIKDASILMKNLAAVSKDFPSIVKKMDTATSRFDNMAKSVTRAGNEVSSAMEAGKAAADQFSQQAIPPAVVLMQKLESIAANLEKMSNQMRQNPSVVIRGSTPPSPGPGE